MGRLLGSVVVVVGFVALAASSACHLADSPDPLHCAAGSHASNNLCVADDVAALTITIGLDDGGVACVATPSVLTVAATGAFQFKNDDNVEHVVTGIDGQSWATIAAHQTSPFIGITKVGHWDYEVSGCATGGTVLIE